MRIVVFGAGGIGGYVGGRLAEVGHEVTLIARGAHLAALQENGLELIFGEDHVKPSNISSVANAVDAGAADLVLFTVKMLDTDEAAGTIAPLIKDNTRIITLQNGIDGKRLIANHVEEERISAGAIFLSAFIKEPGVIEALPGMGLITVDALNGDPVIAEFVSSINKTGSLEAKATDDADLLIWSKFVPLSAFSGITSLTRLPLGKLRENPENEEFFSQLIDETIAVAQALGQELGPEVKERGLEVFRTLPDETKSSLLHDIDAGKKCEIAYLSGRVHQLGKELGVPTPGHSAIWIALNAYEHGPPV